MGRGVGDIYLQEYLKIIERTLEAMRRFPLIEMTSEERKVVVLSYIELVERFQAQLKAAGITKLLDLYDDDKI